MPPENGTMILSVSHMSDLVEKKLETGEVIIDGLPTFVRCNSEIALGFMKLMAERVLEMSRKVGSNKP